MANEIKISVILALYNASEYLDQCMHSVMEQTLQEIEIICVDDGSTDDTLKMLNDYAKRDSRIVVIHQENAGAGAARNNGMQSARGEYLSILDGDDFFEKNMLEKMYIQAQKDQAEIVVARSDQYHTNEEKYVSVKWTLRDKELPPYTPFNHRQMTSNIFRVFVGWAWDKLFLKSFVDKNDLWFQEQRTSNDLFFVFSSIALAKKITIVDEILIHQRRDSKDSLSKTREKSWHCFHDALIALRERLVSEGIYDEVERDYINYALHFTLWNIDTLAEPTQSLLKDKLKQEWLAEFGILDKESTYFYNKQEYNHYKEYFVE